MKRQVVIFVVLATVIQNSFESDSRITFEDSDETVSDSCASKASEEASIWMFRKATDVIFTAIRGEMSKVNNRNKTTSSDRGPSSIAFSRKESLTGYVQGIDSMLDLISRSSSNGNSQTNAIARQLICDGLESSVNNIFEAIVELSTDKNNPQIKSLIEIHAEVSLSKPISITEGIFMAITKGQKRSYEIECIITYYKEKAIHYGTLAVDKIYSGINVVADMYSRNKTGCENSDIAIDKARNEANSACDSFNRIIYESIRILYPMWSASKIDIPSTFTSLEFSRKETDKKSKQGIEIIFGVIESMASNAMNGKRDHSKYQSCISEIAENEVCEAWLDAINLGLDSNSLVQSVSPPVDTTSRYVSSTGAKKGVSSIFEGIESVQHKSYDECMDDLERIQNKAITGEFSVTKGIYMAARNNRTKSHSDKILKLIDDAQNRTIPSVLNATVSIFDGIRFLAKVIAGRYDGHRKHSTTLDTAKSNAYLGFKKEVDIYFDLLELLAVTSSVEQDEIVIVLSAMLSAREKAISELSKGIRLLFAKMEIDMKNVTSRNDNGPHGESEPHTNEQSKNPSSQNAYKNKTTIAMKNSVNTIYNILETINFMNSSVIKSARAASLSALVDMIDDIFRLADATGEDECSKIIAQLSDSETVSTTGAIAIFKNIFLVMRSGQVSVELETAIKQTEHKSNNHIVDALNALSDGIEILKTGTSSETEDGNQERYSAMKAAENKVCSAMEANLRVTFTLIQSLIISCYAKPNKISHGIAQIRYAREVAIKSCQNGIKIIFESMTANVDSKNQKNTTFPPTRYPCIPLDESCPTNAAANATFNAFETAGNAIFDLISTIRPDFAAVAETARIGASIGVKQLVENVFIMIKLIRHNISTGILSLTDVIEEAAKCAAAATIHNHFIPIRYRIESGTEMDAQLGQTEKSTIFDIRKSSGAIFKGLRILIHKVNSTPDDGTRDDSSSMDDARNESSSAITAAMEKIYDEILHVFVHFTLRDEDEMSDASCPKMWALN